MENQTTTTVFDNDDVNQGYYDEERSFTAIVAIFVAGILFFLTLAFCVGYGLAKNKYNRPVHVVETTHLNLT